MTDYDRPAGAYGSEVPARPTTDEWVAGPREDEEFDDRPDNPEAFADPEAATPEPIESASTGTAEAGDPEVAATGTADADDAEQARPGAHAVQGPEVFEPVFDTGHADDVQGRWRDIQASFVDDPHDAIGRAGKLTDEVLSTLTSGLENRRRSLEQNAAEGDTEQLRIALRQYRTMLDHVLAL